MWWHLWHVQWGSWLVHLHCNLRELCQYLTLVVTPRKAEQISTQLNTATLTLYYLENFFLRKYFNTCIHQFLCSSWCIQKTKETWMHVCHNMIFCVIPCIIIPIHKGRYSLIKIVTDEPFLSPRRSLSAFCRFTWNNETAWSGLGMRLTLHVQWSTTSKY